MAESKIVLRESIPSVVEALKAKKQTIGYTSGVFDLLHPGHVDYLERARSKCDCLIVGMNSDSSVRSIKGEFRPINDETSRARVIAGLSAVDLVFIFDEENNNANIELIKPSIYFKAGDYSREKLTSAPIVEQHGGKVELIQLVQGCSSSDIIDRIAHRSHPAYAAPEKISPPAFAPAVFFDRDGTINEHREYLHEPADFALIPRALDGMKRLQAAGYRLVIVTDQPGIGLGYFTKEDLFRVNASLLKAATAAGVAINKLYFCPHNKADHCNCRKPATGMITRAVRELNIDLARSFVIGDMTSDVQLGKNAGCASILLKTGRGGADKLFDVAPTYVADDLLQAAEWIVANNAPK